METDLVGASETKAWEGSAETTLRPCVPDVGRVSGSAFTDERTPGHWVCPPEPPRGRSWCLGRPVDMVHDRGLSPSSRAVCDTEQPYTDALLVEWHYDDQIGSWASVALQARPGPPQQ
jgi:hypothetical protein